MTYRHTHVAEPLALVLNTLCPGPDFKMVPCGSCDGTGVVEGVCCTGYDAGFACRCRRPGYSDVRCGGCNGEGEHLECPRCGSDRIGSDDDVHPVCIACGQGSEE